MDIFLKVIQINCVYKYLKCSSEGAEPARMLFQIFQIFVTLYNILLFHSKTIIVHHFE